MSNNNNKALYSRGAYPCLNHTHTRSSHGLNVVENIDFATLLSPFNHLINRHVSSRAPYSSTEKDILKVTKRSLREALRNGRTCSGSQQVRVWVVAGLVVAS